MIGKATCINSQASEIESASKKLKEFLNGIADELIITQFPDLVEEVTIKYNILV